MSPAAESTFSESSWPRGSLRFLIAFLLFVAAAATAFQVVRGGPDPGLLIYVAIYAAPAIAMHRGWPMARPFFVALNLATSAILISLSIFDRFDPVALAVAVPLVAFTVSVVFPTLCRKFFESGRAPQH